jgi:hypothetical protein
MESAAMAMAPPSTLLPFSPNQPVLLVIWRQQNPLKQQRNKILSSRTFPPLQTTPI